MYLLLKRSKNYLSNLSHKEKEFNETIIITIVFVIIIIIIITNKNSAILLYLSSV